MDSSVRNSVRCLSPVVTQATSCLIPFVGTVDQCVSPVLDCIDRDPLGCRRWRPVPSLPQDATPWQQRERQRELQRRRDQYRYNYTYIPGLAMVDKVPLRECPAVDWLLLGIGQVIKIIDNLVAVMDEDSPTFEKLRGAGPGHANTVADGGEGAAPDVSSNAVAKGLMFRQQLQATKATLSVVRTLHPAGTAEDGVSVRGAPGTAVFSKRSGLMCRELIEPSNCCPVCGDVLPYCDNVAKDLVDLAAAVVKPCTACASFAADIILRYCLDCMSQILVNLLEQEGLTSRPLDGIEGYNRQFSDEGIPLPALGKKTPDGRYRFEEDENFALRQVAGQNPMMLTLIRPGELDDFLKRMPVTDQQYKKAMGDNADSLKKACDDSRLFSVDYGFASNVIRGSDEPAFAGQKYIGTPIGLFALPASTGPTKEAKSRQIRVVAIQCEQAPGPNNPVFTPQDGYKWEIAKTVYNNAAGNNSEFVQHLGYAHLLVEAFGIPMIRTLPDEHPLSVLITPHLEGTIFANDLAQDGMNKPPELNLIGAEISATIEDTLSWTSEAVREVDVSEWMLPKHFERQGTADPAVLPNYPYREDSLRIWHAIRDWVADYVRIYYPSDEVVVEDFELSSWIRECESSGRLTGIGSSGRIRTVEELIDTVTLVIYQGSAHHALTHFPLSKIELYVPALPLSIYQPPPNNKKRASRRDWLNYYSPLSISLIQQSLYFLLGTVHFTELGCYPKGWFVDRRVDKPLQAFQERLKEIEGDILRDNADVKRRPMPYIYLIPRRIPQSTNI